MVISNNLITLNNYELFSINGGVNWLSVVSGVATVIGGICLIATSPGNPFALVGGIVIIVCGVMCIVNS